jgi:hypothetical protein
MGYDSRTDELINRCLAELVRANARQHAAALIYHLRGMHYERALIEAQRYIERVLACSESSHNCGTAGVQPRPTGASTSSSAIEVHLMM